MAKKKICFVISPIGEEESETRKRSDQILKHVIEPSVDECGYKAIRADKIEKPGVITSQVIQHVVEDPLVVADLTGRNPNVFYELAIRHAIRKPFIQIMQKGERLPFDVAGTRTINVDHHDLDSVGEAKKEIVNQIKSLEKDAKNIETPISVSLDLQILRESDDPRQRSLADIMSALTDLPSQIEERISGKEDRIPHRRLRRIHPMMFEEITHKYRDPIGILVLAGFLRDDMPWLYELAIEVYRRATSGTKIATRDALTAFNNMVELTLHGRFAEELGMRSKESYFIMHEFPMFMDRIVERYFESKKRKATSRKK
jgi:hypothetical protein